MTLLTKEQLKAASGRVTADVPVPEWNGSVRLRSLSGADQVSLVKDLKPGSEQGMSPEQAFGYSVNLLALSIVDESGELVFSAEELGDKPAPILTRLAQEAMKLNGIGPAASTEIRESLD